MATAMRMSLLNLNLHYCNRFATIPKHFNVTKVWQTLKNKTSMNGAKFRGENEHLSSSADVLPKTSNLVISCCCFADDSKEIDKDEKMHVQSVQSCCFCPLNVQICDFLVAVIVVLGKFANYLKT